jgi:flavin prenyltransferase
MIVVAITGASGPIMGIRLIEELLVGGEAVIGIASEGSIGIMEHELSFTITGDFPISKVLEKRGNVPDLTNFREYDDKNFNAPCASGTSAFDVIVVAPCSMKSLSAIANGYADNLITRACDVALKERKKCIIIPRETPFNLIHIENMRRATLAGAIIAPPIPGFYTRPQTADDIVDFIVGKILNLLNKKHDLFKGWGE